MANIIDVMDPVDIMMMVDPEVSELVDSIQANDGDYETLFAGIKLECSDEEEPNGDDIVDDTYDAIDDCSTDFLDMEADERIENYEDDDSDGELIDMIIAGIDIDDLSSYDDNGEEPETEEEQ